MSIHPPSPHHTCARLSSIDRIGALLNAKRGSDYMKNAVFFLLDLLHRLL